MECLYPSLCSNKKIKSQEMVIDLVKDRASTSYSWDLNFSNYERKGNGIFKIFIIDQELGQNFTCYFIQCFKL